METIPEKEDVEISCKLKVKLLSSGNELSGSGVGARIVADQYAADIISLKSIVDNVYQGFPDKPLVLAPGGFFDANWFTKLVNKTKPNLLDVITTTYITSVQVSLSTIIQKILGS